jgi:hypothetical protein
VSVRRIGLGALALALGACSGPAEISLGGVGMVTSNPAYLSPTGDDQNPGTLTQPWKTFAAAFRRLGPGSTLKLLDGTYDGGTSGYLDARCVAGARGAANAKSGTDDMPTGRFTVSAVNPGLAHLRGDANGPPVSIEGCAHWVIEDLHADSADLPTAPTTPEAGSVVVIGPNTKDLVLRRLLLAHPNRHRHAHLIHIGEGSSNVLVEECELYDFHENAVETARTSALTFRRNYVNSRGESADIPGGFETPYASGGDFGFLFEETRDVLAENNVLENVHDGFGIVGRANLGTAIVPPNPPEGNRLLGNVVLQPGGAGVRIDSACQFKNPCESVRTVRQTELVDDVVIGGAVGVSVAGAIGTNVRQVSVIGAANGFLYLKEPQNAALQATSTTLNALAIAQAYAFRSEGEASFLFDHCAAFSSAAATGAQTLFRPDDPLRVIERRQAPADLGGCYVNLPSDSPLKGAANGSDVGASVVNRYENGTLTTTPLWLADGSFPCSGAVVNGFNDEAGGKTSCIGVHKRLHVAPAGTPRDPMRCPLP